MFKLMLTRALCGVANFTQSLHYTTFYVAAAFFDNSAAFSA